MMYKQIASLLSKKPGARFTQEQVAYSIGTTSKRAQATLSKLFANGYVERERAPETAETYGRFVYFAKVPVDVDRIIMDSGPRITRKRVTGAKYGQRQLKL